MHRFRPTQTSLVVPCYLLAEIASVSTGGAERYANESVSERPFDEAGVDLAGGEVGVVEDLSQQGAGRLDGADLELV